MTKQANNKPKILFITRKYPPSTGGMENAAYELHKHLQEQGCETTLLKWGGANRAIYILLIMPLQFMHAAFLLLTHKYTAIYLQDGVLASMGALLSVFRVPIVITLHGLDLTYSNRFYQRVLKLAIKYIDRIVCVSADTKVAAKKFGIPSKKLFVIGNGVRDIFYKPKAPHAKAIPKEVREFTANKKILLTSGRLVKRKGVAWFVENSLPAIVRKNPNTVYVIAGEGPEHVNIESVITKKKLSSTVMMLGFVEQSLLNALYNLSDVFVMPNIKVKGDREGFGLVALEASSCALPVVATGIEGITDALQNSENGILLKEGDSRAFSTTISDLLKNSRRRKTIGAKARKYTLQNFGWSKIAEQYLEIFRA